MADTLTSNPIIIDLTSATSRTIRVPRCRVLRVLLDGTKTAAASFLRLSSSSTSGPVIWQHVDAAAAAAFVHTVDDLDVWTDGVYFNGGGAAAWGANAVILVYHE